MPENNGSAGQPVANHIEQEFAAVIGQQAVEITKLRAQLRMANEVIANQAQQLAAASAPKIDAAAQTVVAAQAEEVRKSSRRSRKLSS